MITWLSVITKEQVIAIQYLNAKKGDLLITLEYNIEEAKHKNDLTM